MRVPIYSITTFATEDEPQMTYYYPYEQWKELCEDFKKKNINYVAEKFYVEI